MHRIYLAVTMGYGLGSDDPEELAYYNKLRKKMDEMKKDSIKKGYLWLGISQMEWIDEYEYFFVNWWEPNACRIAVIDDPKRQKEDSLNNY